MNEITREQLFKMSMNYTVRDLLKFIKDNQISEDAVIVVERVKDSYYEGSDISGMGGCTTTPDGIYPPGSKSTGWSVLCKENMFTHTMREWNQKVKDGIYQNRKSYPKMSDEMRNHIYSEEEILLSRTQYSSITYAVGYPEKDILYLDLHY